MRAVVHVAAGATLAVAIGNPWVALPATFMAHFVLDALPHSGDTKDKAAAQIAQQTWMLPIDAVAGLAVMLAIILTGSPYMWLALAGGVLCASPDLLQAPRFIRFLKTGNTARCDDWFSRFHERIQWCERRWGWLVELPFLAVMLYVLFAIL